MPQIPRKLLRSPSYMSGSSIQGARRRTGAAVPLTSVVTIRPFDAERPLAPWMIEPTGPSAMDLAGWARENRKEVDQLLLDRGAILFRGFDLRAAAEFETVAAALTSELYGGYGDLPREGESANIYKSTPYPPDRPILFHNESSHLRSWPTRISFFCMTPSTQGGETPLADCREIARRLDPQILEEFERKELTYIRNFSGLDVSWQQFFATEDRATIERRCRDNDMEFEWTDGGEHLRVRQQAAAVRPHPGTGETLFFNQIQLHHPFHLPSEVLQSLRSMVASDEELPRNVTFGDGTPIPDELAERLLEVYWDTCVMFPWEQGDIITLDNMRTAHARMPFAGERRIAVAMAGMTSG
jgi:alpha-ketoglutarate-dependent taurine dioxygenase